MSRRALQHLPKRVSALSCIYPSNVLALLWPIFGYSIPHSTSSGREEHLHGDFMRSKSVVMGPGTQQAALARTATARSYETEADMEWPLQEFAYNGHTLLLDTRTQRVYFSPDGRSWPQLLGRLDVSCQGYYGAMGCVLWDRYMHLSPWTLGHSRVAPHTSTYTSL